jgi:transcriptional regulator with XRE-family HTH domain
VPFLQRFLDNSRFGRIGAPRDPMSRSHCCHCMTTKVEDKCIFVIFAQHLAWSIQNAGCCMSGRKRGTRQADIVRVFAERLRSVRTSRGMTQRELAEGAHVTLSYVSRLEAGGAAPGIDLLERLAQALRVALTELLPVSSLPDTVEAFRRVVKQRFNAVVEKSGQETLSMLDLFLSRLAESPAALR